MLATSGELPTGADWSYEFKWDGVRAIAALGSAELRLWARSGAEITAAYPEIAPLGTALRTAGLRDVILDGEMVALDAAGRPSFQALAERMHVRAAGRAARLAASVPVSYMIFDLLRLNGVAVAELPYVQRRAALEELVLSGPHWLIPPRFTDGAATVAAARAHTLEGVVAKRLSAAYRPGTRSPDWIKVKLDETDDLVVGGYRPGARELGALLVGVPLPDGRLRFRGRVGGGISAAAQTALLKALRPLRVAEPLFDAPLNREDAKDAFWVRPEIVVEVKYGQRTPDGRLRFPRFVRLRPDKTVADCAPEEGVDG